MRGGVTTTANAAKSIMTNTAVATKNPNIAQREAADQKCDHSIVLSEEQEYSMVLMSPDGCRIDFHLMDLSTFHLCVTIQHRQCKRHRGSLCACHRRSRRGQRWYDRRP